MLPDGHEFALCLTHDVDRTRKTYQSLYYGVRERSGYHLRTAVNSANPYWQFETVMAMEEELGVRSAFYFLNEQRLFRDRPVREWLSPEAWKLYAGRYRIDDPAIVGVVEDLRRGGWEVGLHGSYESYRDPERLRREKAELESVLGESVAGGRQHYLNLDVPETWRHQRAAGLRYDSSLGSSETYGFRHGYDPKRPFDDEFVVFPLTVMELALPNVETAPERAWAECERLLEEARANGAVMTVLWHPSYFNDREHPNYGDLYRRLVERALELGAWVGPPGELYDEMVARDVHTGENPTTGSAGR